MNVNNGRKTLNHRVMNTQPSISLYFINKQVRFVEQPSGETTKQLHFRQDGVSRAKVLKILESCNLVEVLCDDVERDFATFIIDFRWIEAAGGVVVNDRDEWLLIHRNGRWDLPKGHVEMGEEFPQAALREVREETGLHHIELGELVCYTLHCYIMHGAWEIKRTHWYRMHGDSSLGLLPQTEEGIDQVKWCDKSERDEYFKGTFATIRYVAESMNR